MSRLRGGYIGFNRVPAGAALNSAASGVWTLREAEALKRAGTWPLNVGDFLPTLLNGLQLWLDASDPSTLFNATTGGSLVAADGAVARWEDKSGNGRHATQSDSARRPARKTAIQGGRDVLRFDGSNDFFSLSSSLSSTSAHTFIGAAKRNSVPSNFCFAGFGVVSGNGYFPAFCRIRQADHTNVLLAKGGQDDPNNPNNRSYSISNALSTTNAFIAVTVDSMSLRLNGVSLTELDSGFAYQQSSYTAIGMFGGDASVQGFSNADFCEVLYYNRTLGTAEIQNIEAYLSAKWTITVS